MTLNNECFPFTQHDMESWYILRGRSGFSGDIELFNRLCVMLQCTDAESFDDAMAKVMLSLKGMGED
jgi:hypothetical protein